jgi:hypothetical protein
MVLTFTNTPSAMFECWSCALLPMGGYTCPKAPNSSIQGLMAYVSMGMEVLSQDDMVGTNGVYYTDYVSRPRSGTQLLLND